MKAEIVGYFVMSIAIYSTVMIGYLVVNPKRREMYFSGKYSKETRSAINLVKIAYIVGFMMVMFNNFK